MASNQNRSAIGAAAVVVVPLCALIVFGMTAVEAWLSMRNPFGVLSPLAWISGVFAAGFVCVQGAKLAKARGDGVAWWLGLLFGGAMAAGPFVGVWVFEGVSGSLGGSLSGRLGAGIPLWGRGSFSIGGWVLGVFWVVGALGYLAAGLATAVNVCDRPFCEDCRTYAGRKVWFAIVAPVSADGVRALRAFDVAARAVTDVRTEAGGDKRFELTLTSCRCGRLAALEGSLGGLAAEADSVNDHVFGPLAVGRSSLRAVFEWAERVAPENVGERPDLSAFEAAEAEREPFDMSPAAEGPEHASHARFGGTGGSIHGEDNSYTRELRKRLERTGDWRAIEEAFRAQRSVADLSFVAEAAGDWRVRPAWFDDWAADKPDSPVRKTVSGVQRLKHAWAARGTGFKVKNADAFLEGLGVADRELEEAAEANPKDPTPLAWLLFTRLGGGYSIEPLKEVFERACERSTYHYPSHHLMLQASCAKWFGSDEEMHGFARRAGQSPSGSTLHVLVAEAHLEAAYAADRGGKGGFDAYMKRPEVAAELRAADERCFDASKHRVTMETAPARATFAFALWQSGELRAAARHLEVIGTSSPWSAWGGSIPFIGGKHGLRRARKVCGVG